MKTPKLTRVDLTYTLLYRDRGLNGYFIVKIH